MGFEFIGLRRGGFRSWRLGFRVSGFWVYLDPKEPTVEVPLLQGSHNKKP